MGDQEVPWTWKDDGTLTLMLEEGPKEFKLLPADPIKVERFRRELGAARNVTLTLLKAREAFENGSAEYTNAVRRLKKLNVEFGKALDEQLGAAQVVGVFFVPGGIEKEFGSQVDMITEFSAQTIERLLMPKAAGYPPAPPPSQEDPPVPPDGGQTEPEKSAVEEPATAG